MLYVPIWIDLKIKVIDLRILKLRVSNNISFIFEKKSQVFK